MKSAITLFLLAFITLFGTAAQAQSIYALQGGGANLIKFPASDPSLTSTVAITGVALLGPLVAIDFRPATGELYGMGYTTATTEVQLYTIDTISGTATAVGTPLTLNLGTGGNVAFDFNPIVDRIRIITDLDSNFRLNPINGQLAATDIGIEYDVADVNAGADPSVMAVAYTNSYNMATTTTLYAYDLTADVLTTVAPPNNGTLLTVGPSGRDFTALDMDISSDNMAYIVGHTLGMGDSLYTLDLSSGAVTAVRHIGSGLAIQDIAVSLNAPTVGINDVASVDISIYPNPATDKLNVKIGATVAGSVIRVTDIAGRELFNLPISAGSGNTSAIDMSGYAPGMYYVSVVNGTSRTVKAVGKY